MKALGKPIAQMTMRYNKTDLYWYRTNFHRTGGVFDTYRYGLCGSGLQEVIHIPKKAKAITLALYDSMPDWNKRSNVIRIRVEKYIGWEDYTSTWRVVSPRNCPTRLVSYIMYKTQQQQKDRMTFYVAVEWS